MPLVMLSDPGLPGLSLLQQGADGSVLAHQKGRRATVLIREPDGPRIAKLFCREEFDAALTITQASYRHGRLAPTMLGVEPEGCAFWLEVVTGVALDGVDVTRRDRAVARLGPVVAAIHSADTTGLPEWDSQRPARMLRHWFSAAIDVAPRVAEPIAWLVSLLDSPLPPRHLPPVCLHGDHALRHVLHDDVTEELRLVDWDRAAVGPAEVDLAPIVSLLGGGAFLAGYRAAGGQVDEPLLARLVLMNRLTRELCRIHSGADRPRVALRRLDVLLERVGDHRF